MPATGLLGGFFSIAVLSVLAVLFVTPLLKSLRQVAANIPGPYLVRLSLREVVWYPRDLAVALAGLTLAVATAVGVGLMVDSFRADFSQMLERRLSYDLVVRGDEPRLQQLIEQMAGRPDVERLQAYRRGQLRLSGVPVELVTSVMDREYWLPPDASSSAAA